MSDLSESPTKFEIAKALSNAWANKGKDIALSPYRIIEQLMQHKYSPGTNDIQGVNNAANISTMLMGTGAATAGAGEIGAFRPSVRRITKQVEENPLIGNTVQNLGKFAWTPEAENHLMGLHQNYPPGAMGRWRVIEDEFKKQYPNYQGKSEHLSKKLGSLTRVEDQGGSTTLGSNFGNFGERPPGGPPKSKLNTGAPGIAIGDLQSKIPPHGYEEWIKQWAKEAGVPIQDIRGKDTKYIKLKTENPPLGGDIYPTVRIPTDEERHLATKMTVPQMYKMIDTGTGMNVPNSGRAIENNRLRRNEPAIINESGMPYADVRALDARLKYETHKAPGGGNWLISEDMKPKMPQRPIQEIQGPQVPENWAPNQLKLLSGGYTPADILQILRQQSNNNGQ